MKFYYNGKLVRTSKEHIYKYAIVKRADIESDAAKIKPFACSKDLKGIDSNLAYLSKELRVYEAVKKGTYQRRKINGFLTQTAKQIEADAIEYYGSLDAAIENRRQWVAQWVVVELDAVS